MRARALLGGRPWHALTLHGHEAQLEALLAHAMLSIPATKGFEVGSGFAGSRMRGSEHNDLFVARPDGSLATSSNNSGGIQARLPRMRLCLLATPGGASRVRARRRVESRTA